MTSPRIGIDLYWLPLGAGGHSVRLNGRIFEAIAPAGEVKPPQNGRAPGWHAGVAVARRCQSVA